MQQNYPYDKDLVLSVQRDNSSEAMSELIARHSGLVSDIARRISSSYSGQGSGMNIHELNDEIPYLIWRAADSYSHDSGAKFSTWLYHVARGNILDRRKKLYRSVETVELTEEIETTVPCEEPEQISADDHEKIESIKNSINSLKNERKRAIIHSRLFEESSNSCKGVAESHGCSPQYVSDVTRSFIKQQKKKYER